IVRRNLTADSPVDKCPARRAPTTLFIGQILCKLCQCAMAEFAHMTDAEPTSPKQISLGWLVCGGMALGALLVPFAVFLAVGFYNTLSGDCVSGAEDRFGCALRQFVVTALSIIPGGIVGFIIAYWIGRRRPQAS